MAGFYLVDAGTLDFELVLCEPATDRTRLEASVELQIQLGRFAQALRQDAPLPLASTPTQSCPPGCLIPLTAGPHTQGMFCGWFMPSRPPHRRFRLDLAAHLLATAAIQIAVLRCRHNLQRDLLHANNELAHALRDNEILARIPAESPHPILRCSDRGQILYANESAGRLLTTLNCQPGDFLTGTWATLLTETFATQAPREFEWAVEPRTYVFLITPLPAAHYANFYGLDITQRKQAETEAHDARLRLLQSHERLRETLDERRRLMSIAAHDLRSPLAAMQNCVDLLAQPDLPPTRGADYLQLVRRSVRRMLQLLDSLLALDAIESGHAQFTPRSLELSAFVRHTLEELRPPAEAKTQQLTFHPHPTPLTLRADPTALTQILTNLVSNAIKFSPPGSAICVRTAHTDTHVRLEVQDQGPGLTDLDHRRLFTKFTRLSARPTAGEPSLGLGLSIVKHLVDHLGGRIRCESQPGRGANFIVEWSIPDADPIPTLA